MSSDTRPVMLELDNVTLNYQSGKATFDHGVHHVLDGVSFKLYENETLGIIGRNGVGKTTMLRIMAGILAPTSGTVTNPRGKTSSLLSIGLGFKPDLSGRDNAILAAMLQGSTKAQAISFLEEIKEFSDLGDSFEEPVKTYSSGMKSRLGFTTALMTHVDILLIDEVLSVGDAQFRGKAQKAMKERVKGDQTVVFVSHSEAQIQELCDRAFWIENGKIKSEGDTETVLNNYRDSIKKKSIDPKKSVDENPPGAKTTERKKFLKSRRAMRKELEYARKAIKRNPRTSKKVLKKKLHEATKAKKPPPPRT